MQKSASNIINGLLVAIREKWGDSDKVKKAIVYKQQILCNRLFIIFSLAQYDICHNLWLQKRPFHYGIPRKTCPHT